MSQTHPDPRQWCDDLQAKLIAALDAAWREVETNPDPAAIAKAVAKTRLCGQFAAAARKIAALTPPQPRRPAGETRLAAVQTADTQAEQPAEAAQKTLSQVAIARAALERLQSGGGRRGRP